MTNLEAKTIHQYTYTVNQIIALVGLMEKYKFKYKETSIFGLEYEKKKVKNSKAMLIVKFGENSLELYADYRPVKFDRNDVDDFITAIKSFL
jgi:hypothetical protein